MSFDLTLFTRKKIELNKSAIAEFGFRNSNGNLILEKENWQLTVFTAEERDSNHLPKQLKRLKRGIKYSSLLVIEPFGYPNEANDLVESLLEFLTREFHGIIQDHQGNIFYDFNDILEDIVQENAFIETVCLAWYFNDVSKLKGSNFTKLLDLLEKYLPDVLPRKYANYSYEYQYYKKSGRKNFESFAQENITSEEVKLHWIPQNSMIHIDLPNKPLESKVFWSWTLKISIPISEFKKSKYNENALLCWKEITNLLDPFFSEVRKVTELKYVDGNASRMIGRESPPTPNPVFGGYWNGIPRNLGTAISLNKALTELWPKSLQNLRPLNQNQFFLHLDKLNSDQSITDILGKVPRKIRQRHHSRGPRVIPK